LAHSIGVTGAYISLLEREKGPTKQGSPVRPSLHLVDAIAWMLGTSCEEARHAAGFAPPETLLHFHMFDMDHIRNNSVDEELKALLL
jgi:hypothetical protein